ncbi:hypothetical protein [Urechidicola vernalis]|uniref:Uncharacterized protein n=1 Tax=Urechidicola vernalis TaxID=3075600 RepID=A0ABU2Y7E8_9FLAO|nr:hypothetical protein [Urechidicola sp. P050]MDT0554120.1 hypothetical protein [Urechidicola sp. P050]
MNLTDNFLFYIPDNEIIGNAIEESNADVFQNYLDQVILMDWKKGPLMFAKNELQFNEYVKISLLEKNVLKLIERKEKLTSTSFDFIFEKYYNQVRAITFICVWLNDESRLNQLDDNSIAMMKSFELQYKLYEQHLLSLEGAFRKKGVAMQLQPTSNIELQLPILLDQLKTIETNQIANNKIVEYLVATTKKSEIKNKGNSKKPKSILITESEAEEFLLATVFGIAL